MAARLTAMGSRGSAVSLVLGAGLIAFAAFLPALWTWFSGDDFFILSRLQDAGGLADPLAYFRSGFFDYYRPITFLSHAIDFHLWGENATAFHLTSIVLHSANTMLVFALGRRITDGNAAAFIAAVLFALHPAAHEAVYWMAARFDLLSTFFTLASLLLLIDDRRPRYWFGVAAFGLALLAKESAVALIVLAVAYDVILRGRMLGPTVRRLVPLLLVAAGYAVMRAQAGNLAIAGGAARLPKLLVLVAAVVALISIAGARRERLLRAAASAPLRVVVPSLTVLLTVAALWTPTSAWTREKLGFAAYAAFYLLSPVVLPPPPMRFFTPMRALDAVPGLITVVAGVVLAIWTSDSFRRHPPAMFGAVFTAAAFIPVLSLTGSSRYVYVATAGAALLVGYASEQISARARAFLFPVLIAFVLVSMLQLAIAASAWRWGSTMTREGLALMSADLEPCGTKDLLMITAPVGIRGVYCNFYWEAFKTTTDCLPASVVPVLRIVRQDARVDTRRIAGGTIEMRVPDYGGTFVASRDLRHFDVPVSRGARFSILTAAGTLETWPDEATQTFRLQLAESARQARLFYFSDGRVRSLP